MERRELVLMDANSSKFWNIELDERPSHGNLRSHRHQRTVADQGVSLGG